MKNTLLDQLNELGFKGLKLALEEQLQMPEINTLSFDERLTLLLDREISVRNDRRLQLRLKRAKLKHIACIENIDFSVSRNLNRSQILSLASCDWVRKHENIIIVGATGTGKSYLACALAHKACLEGFKSLYLRLPRLFQELLIAKGDGRYLKFMQGLSKVDVLIMDDWGLNPFTEDQCREVLEILDDRHNIKSTIVTSQFAIADWHATLNSPTLADAILDRLVHNAHRVELKGESQRKKNSIIHKKTLDQSVSNG
jgi:DNA replication protein DnaC